MGLAILIVWVIILGIAILLIVSNIKIVPQAHAYVVERLGGYKETWGVGLHFKMPILDRVARRVSLKEQVVDFEPQAVITKDNVTMQIDTVVFYQITDPKKYAYGVESPIAAIENLTATTLRNIIGDLELDETLTSREAILRAEGEKKSTILVAEGEKESVILEAEASKQAAILKAEAEKQKRIKEAEGQAEAIRTVQKATAEGIEYIKEAGADEAVLTLKSL